MGLTCDVGAGSLSFVWTLQRLDPERRRRRLQLLTELADAKSVRVRVAPRRARGDQLRDLIALRRRLAG
ncbi:MAG: hypothetical protein HOV77_30775 [Hamadaea sp.]|uniref:hypothetical protein n=1 Tax=Hamadaea sp. TaxID=2024425 RepID=UPI00183908EA|nr:hypothetical protein [Hamadaea sp.]NUT23572.1 hypothetical protein [Hamadaea sp.]